MTRFPRAPALAGLASYEEAACVGLSVEAAVARLHRYAYLGAACVRLLAARICATQEWEVKGAAALHCWYSAEHVGMFRGRVAEMREPPPDVFKPPTPALAAFAEEFLRPHDTVEYLTSVYGVLMPALLRAYRRHLAATNPIAGHPTIRLLRVVAQEQEEMVDWGRQALAAIVRGKERKAASDAWASHLEAYLEAAGGVDGDTAPPSQAALPAARAAREAFEITREPARDHSGADFAFDLMPRFERPGVTPHEAAWGEMYNRVREMDAVEIVAPLVISFPERDWQYVVDMARQLWDEARHSMMGEVAFARIGADWRTIPIPDIQSRGPNLQLDPLVAHLVLWDIEQSLMPRKTGKGRQRDVAEAAGDALGYQNQDYDWADEVLHTQIGRRWLAPEYQSRSEMKAAAEAANQHLRDVGMDAAVYDHDACAWWDEFYELVCRLEARAGPPERITE